MLRSRLLYRFRSYTYLRPLLRRPGQQGSSLPGTGYHCPELDKKRKQLQTRCRAFMSRRHPPAFGGYPRAEFARIDRAPPPPPPPTPVVCNRCVFFPPKPRSVVFVARVFPPPPPSTPILFTRYGAYVTRDVKTRRPFRRRFRMRLTFRPPNSCRVGEIIKMPPLARASVGKRSNGACTSRGQWF